MRGRSAQVSGGSSRRNGRYAYNLLQSLCGTKTSRAGTNDEDIDVARCSGQHCMWWFRAYRRIDVHLLAIGLAEVTLVGFGPVGVVGGSAGHCEEMYVTQWRLCIRCEASEEEEGWWWRCGRGTVMVFNNNNSSPGRVVQAVAHRYSLSHYCRRAPKPRSPSHLPPINKGPALHFLPRTGHRHCETLCGSPRRPTSGVEYSQSSPRQQSIEVLLLLLAAAVLREVV